MKKILFALFSSLFSSLFLVLVFCMPNVKALTVTEMNAISNEFFGKNVLTSDMQIIHDYWEQNQDKYMYVGKTNSGFWFIAICDHDQGITLYDGKRYDLTKNNTPMTISSTSNVSSSGSAGWLDGTWTKYEYSNVNFDEVLYSPNIPLPDIDVYYILSSQGGGSRVAVWNAEMNVADKQGYFIQYGYKISVPTLVGIGLDSSTGQYTYSYDQYSEGSYIDVVTMQSLTACENISFGSDDMESAWQDAYDGIYDTIPEFYAKIPFWAQNPNAAKYLEAQTYYKNFMMTQVPMFGNRLELFVRLFIVNEDNQVVVGDWLHWSSRSGSKTQEKPSNYVDNMQLPGTENTSNNTDLTEDNGTYTEIGTPSGSPSTVINNNYAPNYPDYPTVATYNHDNILLNFMDTANQLPSFFGEFTDFLTLSFAFIPSWIWALIGMGFTFSIVIMIIKVL